MPLYVARQLCPQLIVVPPEGDRYRACSAQVFAILKEPGTTFEPLSLDEAFIDMDPFTDVEAHALVVSLRAKIKAVTGLTISAGLAKSKLLAKIASDFQKPDGFTYVEPGSEASFLAPLPIGKLYGIGPKSEARLVAAGITTIGALAEATDATLLPLLGRSLSAYRELARGIDHRPIRAHRERKSISSETTFEFNLSGETQLLPILLEQTKELAEILQRKQLRAAGVSVKIKRPDFTVSGKQTALREPTNDARVLFAAARYCLREGDFASRPIRLIGTKVSTLTNDTTRQLPLW